LLDISRIMRGKLNLQREVIDMRKVVEHAVETTRPTIDERNHSLVVRSSPKVLTVCGDPLRLEQILVNLLNNASKFTDPGGEITITVSEHEGFASLRVRDTGRGI